MFGLFITLILGLFILLGAALAFLKRDDESFINFSISIALGVLTFLILLEIIPEVLEMTMFNSNSYINFTIVILIIMIGAVGIKLLDKIVPHHEHADHHNHSKTEIKENLAHIGIVSMIAIIIHNILEGMAVYSVVTIEPRTGLLMMVAIGIHNVPLGMAITSTLIQGNKSVNKTIKTLVPVTLSTFFGGLLVFFNDSLLENELLTGVILLITLGMLIYIIIFELLPHALECYNKKKALIGFIIGALIMIGSLLIG